MCPQPEVDVSLLLAALVAQVAAEQAAKARTEEVRR